MRSIFICSTKCENSRIQYEDLASKIYMYLTPRVALAVVRDKAVILRKKDLLSEVAIVFFCFVFFYLVCVFCS